MSTQPSLKCPKCGKEYSTYREYFACWTSHLNQVAKSESFPPSDHDDAIKFYKDNPESIESDLRILAIEVGIFHGRIDLVGVDKNKNLVIVDVDTGHDWKRKVVQLHQYKNNIIWMGRKIFGLHEFPAIRLLIVKPNVFVKDVTNSPH